MFKNLADPDYSEEKMEQDTNTEISAIKKTF